MSADVRFGLALIGQWDNVTLHEAEPGSPSSGAVFAEILMPRGAIAFGSRLLVAGVPDAQWGQPGEAALVRGLRSETAAIGDPIRLVLSVPEDFSAKAGRTEIRQELNGTAEALGPKLVERIGAALQGRLLDGTDEVKAVIYRDRYLNAPLPVMLLVSFIDAVRTALMDRWANPTIEIVTVPVPEDVKGFQPSTQVFHNWPDTRVRDGAIVAGFDYCGMNAVVRNLPRQQASHARVFELVTTEGHRLRIWFDQGFGYWVVPRAQGRSGAGYLSRFVFADSVTMQGEAIGDGKCFVEGQSFATQIFFEKAG